MADVRRGVAPWPGFVQGEKGLVCGAPATIAGGARASPGKGSAGANLPLLRCLSPRKCPAVGPFAFALCSQVCSACSPRFLRLSHALQHYTDKHCTFYTGTLFHPQFRSCLLRTCSTLISSLHVPVHWQLGRQAHSHVAAAPWLFLPTQLTVTPDYYYYHPK